MRRDCKPHFVDKEGKSIGLRRVEFGDRAIGESFLQEQLHKNPSILPVSELDDSFFPLISLGREIHSIDNLFISPKGRITIVETKLWRNPEATRQVVAQMLDYAKRLNSMTVEELEQACRTARQPAPLAASSLFSLVTKHFPRETPSEPQFTDAVQKTLKNARFMLLVVGDGIRENLEDMIRMLHRYPQMLFTFALVEMQIYENDLIPGRLLVPQLVAHTNEIVRAVVRVEGEGDVSVSVSLPVEPDGKGPTLSEQDFLDLVTDKQAKDIFSRLMSFGKEVGYVRCATKSVSVRIPYGDTGHLRFFRLHNDGRVKIIPLDSQLKKHGVDDQVAWETAKKLLAIFPEVSLKSDKPELSRYLKAIEIGKHLDQFVSVFEQAAEKIKSIFPTLNPLEKEEGPEEEEDEEGEVPNDGRDSDKK
jgi:hypothetical protein